MSDPLIEARELHAHYGSSHVLRGIDFAVHPGETVALMGRNGMGKTTLLKVMLGIVRATRGQVRVRGADCTHMPTFRIVRQGIGYVPEGRGIFPNLSVTENLVMASRPSVDGERHWTLERVLKTFPRLGERLEHGGWQLSGGEQQMLSIGRALMTNPDLLILDEATEGLAPAIAKEIWQIVRDIRVTGIATIIVDKNLTSVLSLADRAAILVKGSVVFAGSRDDLRQDMERVHQYLGV